MIGFLRKVRQKLLDENRFKRYLLYALGEILLVVIGILIALNINDAKQERLNREREITILENIQEDIILDTLDIAFNIKHHNIFLKEEIALLQLLQSDHLLPDTTINYANALGTPLIIILHQSAFNRLQNNDFNVLTNNKLKKDIARFYDFFNASISILENELGAYDLYGAKKPFFQKHFKLGSSSKNLISNSSNSDDYFSPELNVRTLEFQNFLKAKKDEAFKIELNQSITFREIKIRLYLDMIDRIIEINSTIDIELRELHQ